MFGVLNRPFGEKVVKAVGKYLFFKPDHGLKLRFRDMIHLVESYSFHTFIHTILHEIQEIGSVQIFYFTVFENPGQYLIFNLNGRPNNLINLRNTIFIKNLTGCSSLILLII
jgi:hypothetical protein